MTNPLSTRTLLAALLMATPLVVGCNQDTHSTVTGLPTATGLTPNEGGPGGSGSIHTYKLNAGGPGDRTTAPTAPTATPEPAPAEHGSAHH